MSLANLFEKHAAAKPSAKAAKGILDTVSHYAGKAKDMATGAGKGAWSGAVASADDKIIKHLKLEGLKHIGEGYEAMGQAKGLHAKSKAFAHGLGKAAPSLAAGAAYLGAAKKVYDVATGPDKREVYEYYGS